MEDAGGGRTENKLKKLIYLAAPGLSCDIQALSCGLWDLVPWPGIELRPQALGAWSLGHWTTREVPKNTLFSDFRDWTVWETGLQVLLNGKGVNKSEGRKEERRKEKYRRELKARNSNHFPQSRKWLPVVWCCSFWSVLLKYWDHTIQTTAHNCYFV